jgi:hypothetical protein
MAIGFVGLTSSVSPLYLFNQGHQKWCTLILVLFTYKCCVDNHFKTLGEIQQDANNKEEYWLKFSKTVMKHDKWY